MRELPLPRKNTKLNVQRIKNMISRFIYATVKRTMSLIIIKLKLMAWQKHWHALGINSIKCVSKNINY